MSQTTTLILDTNALLHYPQLADIDYRALVKGDQVKLVICLTVVKELDDKKRDSRLADRAERAIRDIAAYRKGTPVRPGVALTVYNNQYG